VEGKRNWLTTCTCTCRSCA